MSDTTNEILIRSFKAGDEDGLRGICRTTATAPAYQKKPELVTTLFCDYYFEQEAQNLFVAANLEDKPVGYVLCAENYADYLERFNRCYFARVRALSLFEALLKRLEPLVYLPLAKKGYTAHLHIDLLPVCQGKGVGTRLLRTLEEHLKAKGIKGLNLTVGADNKGAIAFYEKLGYVRLKSIFGKAFVYGKLL